MTHFAVQMVMPPIPAFPELPDESKAEAVSRPLSRALRAGTELAHKEVELRLALPGSIRSLTDYRSCLQRFYPLYSPMEMEFRRFVDWQTLGFDPSGCSLSARLAADLHALSVSISDIPNAPATSLPPLRDFASALGACYVMEGSALGSQFMMPQLQKTLGEEMTGADTFFRGRGADTGAFWKSFRASLDLYGDTAPEQISRVICSANSTFEAIGLWMQP